LSNIKISIWEHEPSKWSGPAPNWTEAPFVLSISAIKVSCLPLSETTTTAVAFVSSKPKSSELKLINNNCLSLKFNMFFLLIFYLQIINSLI